MGEVDLLIPDHQVLRKEFYLPLVRLPRFYFELGGHLCLGFARLSGHIHEGVVDLVDEQLLILETG